MLRALLGSLSALALAGAVFTAGAAARSDSQAPAAGQTAAERGEYLVKSVAMCVECHSPRDQRGELIQSQLLQGAPMPARWDGSPRPWAYVAPKLAGLPSGFTEESFVRFLQTGERTGGHVPRPPMPPYRMSEEDARAVAAYLKSLR